MNPKYLYLTVDLIAFALPFLSSFIPKAPFYKEWRYVGLALLGPALFFIAWDMLFTHEKIWGFNPAYITGKYFIDLPLEEILFFFCIPYACVFTYFALHHLVEKDYLFPHQEIISSALCIILIIGGIYNMDKWYTTVTFFLLGFFIAYQMLVLRPKYMGRFYMAFAIILFPFMLVNGILTGMFTEAPVVWYNPQHILGLLLFTIPLEDVFFGMLLFLLNIVIYEKLKDRASAKRIWTGA